MDTKLLYRQATELFGKRGMLMSLWQEQADNFYPERADFTLRRALGTDFAAGLMTSYPVLCRRDLQDQIGTMLRPTTKNWAHMTTNNTKVDKDTEARAWMQWAVETMRRAMYDPKSFFNRATKEGDGDYSCFGQAALSVDLNRNADGLTYRCWHLRDVAWMEDEDGKICAVFRKWKPTAYDLKKRFPRTAHSKILEAAEKEPFSQHECMHMVVAADLYTGPANPRNLPWVSIFYEIANETELEVTPRRTKQYIITRWQTVSGSQYAFSPATVAALPEARLIQAMTYTLLEAGEKATNPPVVATIGAVRSDIALYAGGETWVDGEYDERLGEALRPLQQDLRGLPIGIEMQKDSRVLINQAFYLNKLSLPRGGPEMTAYEVGQLVQEYIRAALPLFEPMEADYDGQLCEETFELMRWAGGFGSMRDMPKALQGQDISWRFESPLHDMIESQKGQKFIEAKGLVAVALEIDQTAATIINSKEALRDALNGIGVPASWQRSQGEVDAMDAKAAEQQATAQILQSMQAGADVASTLATANKDTAAAHQAVAA